MRHAICNEMFKGWPHEKVAASIAGLGYQGVELAPFTFGEFPDKLPFSDRAVIRSAFESNGLTIVGLHWLLVGPGKFSITTPDHSLYIHTRNYLAALVGICADLGGQIMVFGSPRQRNIGTGDDPAVARHQVVNMFKELSVIADDFGITICFEPLTAKETNFINTMKEGIALINEVNHPAFQLHLDVKAMAGAELKSAGDTIIEEGGKHLRHFHANDPNLLGPGMGDLDQAPIGRALHTVGYKGWISVETFVDGPGPEETARASMESLKKCYV